MTRESCAHDVQKNSLLDSQFRGSPYEGKSVIHTGVEPVTLALTAY